MAPGAHSPSSATIVAMAEHAKEGAEASSNSVEHRDDRRFGQRYVFRNAVLAVPLGLALVVMWRNPHSESATWIGAAFVVLWIAGWIVADVAWFRRYRCPSCGAVIRSPKETDSDASDPIVYVCRTCNIEWDTRLRQGDD